MSGYNYYDQGTCPGCNDISKYRDMTNINEFVCDQKCICRGTDERSNRDKMDYEIYVLGKKIDLPLLNAGVENFTMRTGPCKVSKKIYQ